MAMNFIQFLREHDVNAERYKQYTKHFRSLYWAQHYGVTPSYDATARARNQLHGHRLASLLAHIRCAEQARARGDYKRYAALAEHVWHTTRPDLIVWADSLERVKLPHCYTELLAQSAKPAVPWSGKLSAIAAHHVRVSESDPHQVCYYRSGTKFLEGKQLRTTPGKYLAEFYPQLAAQEVKTHAAGMTTTANDFHFVENTDPDAWVDAYAYPVSASGTGCSCMRYCDAVCVYAYPGNGLRLATLWSGAPFDSTLLARSIVRDDTQPPQYIRPYTQVGGPLSPEQFGALLERSGYVHGSLDGIRVQRIEYGNGFVMPYIDAGCGGEQTAEEYSDYLLLGEGELECNNTNGTCYGGSYERCERCGDRCATDDMTYIEDHGSVCQDCLDNYYRCAITSWYDWGLYKGREWHDESRCTYDHSTEQYVADSIIDEHGAQCEHCGDYYSDSDDLTPYLDRHGDRYYTCCTRSVSEPSIAPDDCDETTDVERNAIVEIRDATESAWVCDCWQHNGTWYLNSSHPAYDAELDDPDYEPEEDQNDQDTEPSTSCEPLLAERKPDDLYQLAA